ncbi:DUF4150 domain-containing protein [Sorangium sp. KYC3313]|uniref:DUF4150 domain-containing protein n=1 Tax=Sorangium sp. KYC3313 TaxID=3449740 RepID=UPI003F88C850
MFPVTTTQAGICQAMPDTCKTPAPPGPPVPLPYPNVAMCNQAVPSTCALKVLVEGKPVLTKQSEIPMSTGDEAGAAGGVVSGKIKGEAMFRSFSAKVKAEGNPVVFHACTVAQNGKSPNMPMGVQVAPSQAKVMVSG